MGASDAARAQDILPIGLDTDISGQMNITADEIIYFQKEDRYIAKGHVVIVTLQYTIHCDRIEVKNKTGDVQADGNVVVEGETTSLECQSLHLNRATNQGTVVKGTLYIAENDASIKADKITKVGEGAYVIDNARYTTCKCEPDETPDWSVTADSINMKQDGYAKSKSVTFRVKSAPVFHLPRVIFPVDQTRQSGLLIPQFGYSTRNGFETELPFYLAPQIWWDATFTEHFLEQRGYKNELEFRWARRVGREGILETSYLDDWEYNLNRWSAVYTGRVPLWAGVDWRQDLRFVSDNDYIRDFRSDGVVEARARALETRMIFDRAFQWGGASLFFRGRDDLQGDEVIERLYFEDSDGDMPQQLPRLGLKTLLIPIYKSGVQFGVHTSFDDFYREKPTDAPTDSNEQWSRRADLHPYVTATYFPVNGIYVSPEAGWRGTGWQVYEEDYGRSLFVGGLETGTRFYRIYQDKYKHTVEPRIRYFITRDAGSDLPEQFDMTDRRTDYSMVEFNLDQHFLLKKYDRYETARGDDVLQLELTQRYTPEDATFRMFRTQLIFKMFENTQFEADAHYEIQDTMYKYVMAGITHETEKGSKITTLYRYQGEDGWQFVRNRVLYQLSPAVAVTYMNYFNITENQFVDHGGGVLLSPPSDCWSLLSEVIYHSNPDEEMRVNFWINLKGLGSGGSKRR